MTPERHRSRGARCGYTESRTLKLVIEKSTVPAQNRAGIEARAFGVRAQERCDSSSGLQPGVFARGNGRRGFLHPDRIVVGVEDETAERQLKDIYRPVLERKFKQVRSMRRRVLICLTRRGWLTTINSAELIKHASNSFLAVKISYARIWWSMLAGAARRRHWRSGARSGHGPAYWDELFPVPAWDSGGFCLPKDLQAFVHLAEKSGVDFSMLKEAEKINKKRIDHFVGKNPYGVVVVKGKQFRGAGPGVQTKYRRYPLRASRSI